MNTAEIWAVYYTAPTNEVAYNLDGTTTETPRAAGYVWNRIVWDGVSEWSPPAGSAVVQDTDNAYPIGSTYQAPSASGTAG